MSEENKDVKTGVCVWFDAKKGFGFIAPDNNDEDIFLHWSNLEVEGFKTVKPNQKVSYELGKNHHGVQAVNVVVHEMAEENEVDHG